MILTKAILMFVQKVMCLEEVYKPIAYEFSNSFEKAGRILIGL